MKFGVIVFPGSNCDHDAYWTIQQVAKQPATLSLARVARSGELRRDYCARWIRLWRLSAHRRDREVLAGHAVGSQVCGRRRPGAGHLQRIPDSVLRSGLLPGALMRNVGLKYVCKPVQVRSRPVDTPFTNACREGEVLTIPIGHMEGNYFCDQATLERTEARRVALCSGTSPADR